jgi:hypothetical protein
MCNYSNDCEGKVTHLQQNYRHHAATAYPQWKGARTHMLNHAGLCKEHALHVKSAMPKKDNCAICYSKSSTFNGNHNKPYTQFKGICGGCSELTHQVADKGELFVLGL